MIVLSDTSPLNYLVLIGHADVLRAVFGQVVIPEAVVSELTDPRAPRLVREWVLSLPDWCEVKNVSVVDTTIQLGKGEREAISLAFELGADLLLMDDRVARSYAEHRALRVAGTLNVLEAAAERDLLDLPTAIASLRQTNFHIAEDLLARALATDAARKR